MKRYRVWSAITVTVLTACCTLVRAADDVADHLKQTLQQRFPAVKVEDLRPAPVPGLYEIIAGDQVVYADPTGTYLLVGGRLMDTRTREDLSAQYLEIHKSIDFSKLPLEKAIKIVKGKGRRRLAIFEDPDCPYCLQLEKELQSMNDLTVYVFLFPLESVHPGATAHARAIWCSHDRSSAWTRWMLERKQPLSDSCPSDPIADIQALAASMRINSTPTLFLESGRRIGSVLPSDQLEKLLAPAPEPLHQGAENKNVTGWLNSSGTASVARSYATAGGITAYQDHNR